MIGRCRYASQFPRMIKLWRQAWSSNTGVVSLAAVPFGFAQIGPRDCLPYADHQGLNHHGAFVIIYYNIIIIIFIVSLFCVNSGFCQCG
jgi:hypothetical protein